MDYKWDLTRIFKDEDDYKNSIAKLEDLLSKINSFKGRILENENTFLELLKLETEISKILNKIYVYSYLGFYDNMADVKFQKYKEFASSLMVKADSATSFIVPEILSSDFSLICEFIEKNKELELFKTFLLRLFREKEHILSEKEEKILSDLGEVFDIPSDAYDAINETDASFGKIKNEENENVVLTSSNYSLFLTSKNEKVRKSAFKKKHEYYKNHINTISSLYIGQVKSDVFNSKTRKYNSTLEAHLFSDNIDAKLYKNLVKITNKNTKYLKDYYKFKGECLGRKLHMYDLYLNTSKIPEKKISYEESIKIINEALKPLGEDYLDKFNYLINNRCVDVYPKDKKRSGAYQWGTYGVLPYVSLNYENNIDSVSTFAHEMGHAMHTYYSNEKQDYLYANYPIFLAEIASTFNEVLLSNYLIKNAENNDEKEYHLIDFLDKF